MKNVQALLSKEAKAKEILANIGAEKETLAINKLTEVKEILAALDCSYLLETSIPSPMAPVTNVTINKGKVVKVVEKVEVVKAPVANVTIQKGKVVKIEKEVEIERIVVDTKEIEKHLETISNKDKEIQTLKKTVATWQSKATKQDNNILKQAIDSKDKYIAELESKLSDKAYQAANDGYLVDGTEVSLEVVNNLTKEVSELEERIAELEAQLEAKKKSPKERAMEVLNSVSDLELEDTEMNSKEYLEMLANQEESCTHVSKETVVPVAPVVPVEEKQQPVNVLADAPSFVKLTNVNFKNDKAKMYQTEKCYLIGSPTTNELTWISNETLSDEYKKAVERVLIDEHKFSTNRAILSPVTVTTKNGHIARCAAVNGYDTFSTRDKLTGYIKLSNKFYLYTYQGGYTGAFIDDLDLLVAGANCTRPKKETLTTLNSMIMNLVHAYGQKVKLVKEEREKQDKENISIVNEKKNKREEERKAQQAILEASGIKIKKKGALKPGLDVNSNVSNGTAKKTSSVLSDLMNGLV